ncbi:hypothetical protein [Halobacterium bonnevillei]|uniref:hypothetical protein n=1 Tax=Halobacterium bonnevillei TaxID=2692200 RepID=UPI001916AC4F|nr:hypothetical protein [Halobacterium bonnevillei]
MSNTPKSSTSDERPEESDLEAVRTQLAVLREENERLRTEYVRARQTSYRRTAAALLGIGVLAFLAGGLLRGVRDVLFVLGAIGVFGGVLTWYLTPERVLTVGVSESVYDAVASNGAQLRDELGLQATSVYVPAPDGPRLFVPQHQEYSIPESLDAVFLTGSDAERGVALTPSGQRLVAELDRTRTGPAPDTLRAAVSQLGDAVVEQFEVADAIRVAESTADDRVVVTIEGSAFGSLSDFDHPVVSVLGCGLAQTQDTPIAVSHVDDTTVAFETA